MEEHKHYWWGENKQHHPDYEVIIRMIDPRVFIKYSVRLALLADFDEFYNSIADVQWIDGKPDKATQNKILIEAWNFLTIEERILEDDLDDLEDMEDF